MSPSLSADPIVPDWGAVRRRIGDHSWAAAIIDSVASDAAYWRSRLRIPGPGSDSAWTHHYFCDDDGERLTFDPARPDDHRCARCGRRYRDDLKDGAWRTIMHNAVAAQVQRDALIIRLRDDQAAVQAALTELGMIIDHYGNRYREYREHGSHVGIGRVLPQNLDESIWVIGLLRSVRWVEDKLPADTIAAAWQLARGAAELLRPQVGMIHNIHCWMLAALAECALRLQDHELSAFTLDSEFGVKSQLSKGFRPEGMWWEINPNYHYYTVQALLCWVEAVGQQAVTDAMAETLQRAVVAPTQLAYSDGLLPAYGDGWPDVRLATFAPHAEAARRLVPGNTIDLAPFYSQADEQPIQLWGGATSPVGPSPALAGRASVAALIFGPDSAPMNQAPDLKSFDWPGCGIALLRDATTRIALRSGPDSGWHDHHDKLAVDIETSSGWRSADLGTSGYGADFTNWLRSPAAHSTVFVGDRPQPRCDGAITEFTPTHAVGVANWPGCRLSRRLDLTPGGWTDVVDVVLDHDEPIEWLLHGDGLIAAPGDTAPGELGQGLGHRFLRNVRRLPAERRQVQFSWAIEGAPTVELQLPDGFRAYTAEADGNPTGRALGIVIVRGTASTARIAARFRTPGGS